VFEVTVFEMSSFRARVRFDLVLDRHNQRKLLVYKTQRTEFYLAARNVGETKGLPEIVRIPDVESHSHQNYGLFSSKTG